MSNSSNSAENSEIGANPAPDWERAVESPAPSEAAYTSMTGPSFPGGLAGGTGLPSASFDRGSGPTSRLTTSETKLMTSAPQNAAHNPVTRNPFTTFPTK